MRTTIFSRILHGQLISLELFARNWLLVLTGVVLLLMYITNKYNTQTKMEEIRALNRELQIVKTERIRIRSAYMSRIRESGMQELVDSLGLGLTIRERPPYSVTHD
ncbi:MAG: hypothetical protein HDS15_04545 [Bacteroides sp.]|nr:hypothetical protein [Bacteroides sp.]MDE7471734.1 hypothetical protein [Paramuribaculum sp.]